MDDEISQAEAFDRELDARTAQAIAEAQDEQANPLTCDPFTPEKMLALVIAQYNFNPGIDRARIWWREYADQNAKGELISIYDFVQNLRLDDI